jgi:hypothetical protein
LQGLKPLLYRRNLLAKPTPVINKSLAFHKSRKANI